MSTQHIAPQPAPAVEGAALLMNQVFMLIGYVFWGWTIQELLFFYWVEPVLGLLLWGYLDLYLPVRMGLRRRGEVALKAALALLWWLATLAVGAWLMMTVASLSFEWLAVLVLFVLILLLPIVQQWRHGLMPTQDGLPLQLRTILHPVQLILTPLMIAAVLFFASAPREGWLVAILLGSKTTVELGLWWLMSRKK